MDICRGGCSSVLPTEPTRACLLTHHRYHNDTYLVGVIASILTPTPEVLAPRLVRNPYHGGSLSCPCTAVLPAAHENTDILSEAGGRPFHPHNKPQPGDSVWSPLGFQHTRSRVWQLHTSAQCSLCYLRLLPLRTKRVTLL